MTKAIDDLEPVFDAEAVEKAVHAALVKVLGKPLSEFLKDATAADVHQTTGLGNEKKKKKTFLSTIADAKDDQTSVGKAEWSLPFQIVSKAEGAVESDPCLIFGWASISTNKGQEIVDKQGDVVPTDELEKAAYDFVLYSRSQGDMHVRRDVGAMIESFVFTKQKQDLLGIDLGLEGWWVGFSVMDPVTKAAVRAGDLPEFSVAGRGRRTPVE